MIRRLEQEVRRPTCPISRNPHTDEDELECLVNGCKINLNVLDQVSTKYNALSERGRNGRPLWRKICCKVRGWRDVRLGEFNDKVDVLHVRNVTLLDHCLDWHQG